MTKLIATFLVNSGIHPTVALIAAKQTVKVMKIATGAFITGLIIGLYISLT